MMRMNVSVNAGGAVEYFDSSLSAEDYYHAKGEIAGRWFGRAAPMLGLEGEVTREQFSHLVHNKHPESGERLTLRNNTNRRCGFDVCWNAPKSLSVAYALTQDQELLSAWQGAVRETMQEMEKEVQVRVRKEGQQTDRVTGNWVYAAFTHFTARPEAGYPDMHLHTHCYVINCSHDQQEQAWKAIELGDIKRDAPYWESLAHSKVADRLAQAGYDIRRTRQGWELAAVPSQLIDRFSSRTNAIEKVAREKNITSPEEKARLGAKTRQKKVDLSPSELRSAWVGRLEPDEKQALDRLAPDARRNRPRHGTRQERQESAQKAVEHSLSDALERNSVVGERQLLRQALKHGVGQTGLTEIQEALKNRPDVITSEYHGQRLLTTNQVLLEEQRMVDFARRTRGSCLPYVEPVALRARETQLFTDGQLSTEQRSAVTHVLTSQDQVMVIHGKAGTGKSRSLRQIADILREHGHSVVAVAPSAEASRKNLRDAGFAQAETLAHLLQNEQARQKLKPRDLILVDEAGQVGTKDMQTLFAIAFEKQARVLLVGDTRQHGPVPRGQALKILEQSGIVAAEIKNIRRQHGTYREAVEALSEGKIRAGFEKLEELKAIREIPLEGERYSEAAKDYVELTRKGKDVLVVSPTHHEADRVTEQIRLRLRNEEMLGASEHVYTRLQSLGMTEAMRADAVNYQTGDVVCFRQRARGFAIGHRTPVLGHDEQGQVLVRDTEGRIAPLPLDKAKSFEVYESAPVSFAPGDKIRFTQNGKTTRGNRINNGSVQTVAGFQENGDIRLENGWIVNRDFGHLKHGYVTTSYSAQSRSVDTVLIVQGRASAPAASQAQAYVSVSRGKSAVRIYCDDKKDLETAMQRADARISASELVGEQLHQQRRSRQKRQAVREQVQPTAQQEATRQAQQRLGPERDRA